MSPSKLTSEEFLKYVERRTGWYDVPIVRGAFTQLLVPGLSKAFFNEDYIREIERQDEMAVLHPDTSEIPIWRRRPTRVEHPMEAWRAWGMEITSPDHGKKISAFLKSVAADCEWDGPVLRSHKRPVDPKYWDAVNKNRDYQTYREEMADTFHVAGIWAVKTKEESIYVAQSYNVSTYGRIKMWGRVAQFTRGYRAEACMIDELWLIAAGLRQMFNTRNSSRDDQLIETRIQKIVTALENRYQCKVNLDNTARYRR